MPPLEIIKPQNILKVWYMVSKTNLSGAFHGKSNKLRDMFGFQERLYSLNNKSYPWALGLWQRLWGICQKDSSYPSFSADLVFRIHSINGLVRSDWFLMGFPSSTRALTSEHPKGRFLPSSADYLRDAWLLITLNWLLLIASSDSYHPTKAASLLSDKKYSQRESKSQSGEKWFPASLLHNCWRSSWYKQYTQ